MYRGQKCPPELERQNLAIDRLVMWLTLGTSNGFRIVTREVGVHMNGSQIIRGWNLNIPPLIFIIAIYPVTAIF